MKPTLEAGFLAASLSLLITAAPSEPLRIGRKSGMPEDFRTSNRGRSGRVQLDTSRRTSCRPDSQIRTSCNALLLAPRSQGRAEYRPLDRPIERREPSRRGKPGRRANRDRSKRCSSLTSTPSRRRFRSADAATRLRAERRDAPCTVRR
jgi:hypothetical protein